ncbi:hypothetical protein JCM10213_007443 [Rhodosporidiobolus nylandii]
MTRPIAVGETRIRPSRSCAACRSRKAKCTGLSEEFLHALDDEEKLAAWQGERPRCDRCVKAGPQQECSFLPSKRKGRPRRLPKPDYTPPVTPPSPPQAEEASPPPQFTPSSVASSSLFTPAVSPDLANAAPFGACPSAAAAWPSPPDSMRGRLGSTSTISSPSAPPSNALFLPEDIPQLARRYLVGAFTWAPLLPPNEPDLVTYLQHSHPVLPAALSCLLDLSLPPPAFPPSDSPISSSVLLAGGILALQAFGVKDVGRCASTLRWTCEALRDVGWSGTDETHLQDLEAHEAQLLNNLGWMCWAMEQQLGVLTSNRERVFSAIPAPTASDLSTILMRAAALLRDATDFSVFWDGDDAHRFAYTSGILERSDAIREEAIAYLRSFPLRPALSLTASPTAGDLHLSAAHEMAILGALMSSAAVILLLCSTSPLSPLISPKLCSLDTTSVPALPARVAIRRAAVSILEVLQFTHTSPARRPGGALVAPTVRHSPMYGCCVVVAANGMLLDAGTAPDGKTPGDLDPLDAAALKADLDLCEAVLQQQSENWPAAEMLADEVALLRRTAGFA